MSRCRDLPAVVRLRDEVTGSLAVIPADQIATVLAVWFPRLTTPARRTIQELGACAAAGEWDAADELARSLGILLEPFPAKD